jgi:hypothetical protein
MTLRRITSRLLACALLAALALNSGCADPATMGAMAAATAAEHLIKDIANSPKTAANAAAETAVAATGGDGKTTVIKGRTGTVIIKDGKTIVIPHRTPTE